MKTLIVLTAMLTLGLPPVLAQQHKEHHENETAEEHAAHAKQEKGDHDGHDHSSHGKEEHADDEEARHGGIVAHTGPIHFELVPGDEGITLYAEGLPEGEDVRIRLTLLQGKKRQQINMSPAQNDEHRFDAKGDFHLETGDKIVALVRAGKAKPVLARFEMP